MFWGNMAWHGLVRLAWSWACPLAWPGQADGQTPTLEKSTRFWYGLVWICCRASAKFLTRTPFTGKIMTLNTTA